MGHKWGKGKSLTSNDGTSKAVTAVETDTVTTSAAVNFNLASIGLEILGGILSGDTALDGETTGGDAVLGKTKLLKSSTSGDLDLGGDNVDPGDLLSNGVLDLDTGVDLNEIVAVLLVDKELSGTGVAVVDRLGELDGIGQDSIASLGGKVLSGGNLDDLLVATLDGAVTLVQVDNVAVVVTKKLDLDVLGLVEEALDENGAVAKGTLGLGGGALEGLPQGSLLADDTHTTTTSAIGSLDDDGEAVLVGEVLDGLEGVDSTLSTGDDGDTGGNGKLASRDLVTKSVDHFGRRADKLRRTG